MNSTMIGLRAETSIHAGTGQNSGVIDLPIQREAHTGWPCVFGSAMKGAIRAHAEVRKQWPKNDIERVFGKADASASSGIAVTDARLLLLPVRSLTGHFKLCTCLPVLKRLLRDLRMSGLSENASLPEQEPKAGQVYSVTAKGDIYLEEFAFEQQPVELGLDAIITLLAKFGADADALKRQLLIMREDDFADFCRTATAITPHICIEDKVNKTVKAGGLWYEETLPPETLLYAILMGNEREEVITMLADNYLQVGGNETVGMGWCSVHALPEKQK